MFFLSFKNLVVLFISIFAYREVSVCSNPHFIMCHELGSSGYDRKVKGMKMTSVKSISDETLEGLKSDLEPSLILAVHAVGFLWIRQI